MSEMVRRATRAVFEVISRWAYTSTGGGRTKPPSTQEVAEQAAHAALLAALDPHDSKLQDVILRAMGFYSEGGEFGPMARVQAHDAIAALRAAASQGES